MPELLQDDATAENLAQAAANLYDDTVTRRRLEALFAGFAASLDADTGGLAAEAVATELRAAGVRMLSADDRELVAGIDEAGRGPLAGPVVAAAVILDPRRRDSRAARLEAPDRAATRRPRRRNPRQGRSPGRCGEADVEEIDRINILQATMLAMRRAVRSALGRCRARRWIDGNRCPELGCAMRGDRQGRSRHRRRSRRRRSSPRPRATRCWSSSTAGIPLYGFAHNRGYGTPEHLAALARHGPCPAHRRSFAPVAQTSFDF